MTSREAVGSLTETATIFGAGMFTKAVESEIGRIAGVDFFTIGECRFTYISGQSAHPTIGEGSPRLRVRVQGVDALFYTRKVEGEENRTEVSRAILFPVYPGSRMLEIGTQKVLTDKEVAALVGIIKFPSAESITTSKLLEVSQSEQSEIDSAKIALFIERQKEEPENMTVQVPQAHETKASLVKTIWSRIKH